MQTDRQTDRQTIFFHMTLPTVEGKIHRRTAEPYALYHPFEILFEYLLIETS